MRLVLSKRSNLVLWVGLQLVPGVGLAPSELRVTPSQAPPAPSLELCEDHLRARPRPARTGRDRTSWTSCNGSNTGCIAKTSAQFQWQLWCNVCKQLYTYGLNMVKCMPSTIMVTWMAWAVEKTSKRIVHFHVRVCVGGGGYWKVRWTTLGFIASDSPTIALNDSPLGDLLESSWRALKGHLGAQLVEIESVTSSLTCVLRRVCGQTDSFELSKSRGKHFCRMFRYYFI